jgi:hypothetical protein
MALPSSGALSFGSIAGEMGISAANNLSYLSAYAGNSSGFVPNGLTSAPYAMGEFFGFNFQSLTYTLDSSYYNDPCGSRYGWYRGSDGRYYFSPGGGLVDGYGAYIYTGYEWWSGMFTWNYVIIYGGYVYTQYSVSSWCGGGPGMSEI